MISAKEACILTTENKRCYLETHIKPFVKDALEFCEKMILEAVNRRSYNTEISIDIPAAFMNSDGETIKYQICETLIKLGYSVKACLRNFKVVIELKW